MKKEILQQIITKAAYDMAKKNVNSTCTWVFYQPKAQEALEKLKKKND